MFSTSYESSVARQAAAADLWLELTGRKGEAAFEQAKEAMASLIIKHADGEVRSAQKPAGPGASAGVGAALGGGAGAALAGGLAHRHNAALAESGVLPIADSARNALLKLMPHPDKALHAAGVPHPAIEKAFRALPHEAPLTHALAGGGVVGAGVGATLGAAYGLHKLRQHMSRAEEPAKEGAADAAALKRYGITAAGAIGTGGALGALGYAIEKRRHTPGKGGESKFQIKAKHQQIEDAENTLHKGRETPITRLKARYYAAKKRSADQASDNPRKSALLGAGMYAAPAALVGGAVAHRIAR